MKLKCIRISALAGVVACVMEFIIEFYAASKNSGYSSVSQRISFLGNPESPTHHLIKNWSIIFTLLFVFFAFGFYKAFKISFKHINLAALLLLLYGVGQGIGAGLFCMDVSKTKDSWVNLGHDIFSGLGDLALVLFPIMMLYYFSKRERFFTMLISVFGIALMLFFLSAKFELVPQIIPYKGLWQRLCQGVYYVYFIFIGYQMSFKNSTPMD